MGDPLGSPRVVPPVPCCSPPATPPPRRRLVFFCPTPPSPCATFRPRPGAPPRPPRLRLAGGPRPAARGLGWGGPSPAAPLDRARSTREPAIAPGRVRRNVEVPTARSNPGQMRVFRNPADDGFDHMHQNASLNSETMPRPTPIPVLLNFNFICTGFGTKGRQKFENGNV